MDQGEDTKETIGLLRALVREPDPARLFPVAAQGAATLLGADGAGLIVREEPKLLRYRFFYGLPEAYRHLAAHAFSERLGVAGAALSRREAVFVADYAHSPYALPEYVQTGLSASLCLPVAAAGATLGVLAISWFGTTPQAPSPAQSEILAIVSDLVGAALHRAQIEQRLRDLAMHDPLTGTANRSLFFDRLTHALAGSARRERLTAVVVLDIDRFKFVNDAFGHASGDALLRSVAERLQATVRVGDTVARLGGDEFALILEDIRCYQEIETIVERMRQAVRRRWGGTKTPVTVSASLGITVYPLDDGRAEELLRNADLAMYEAKRKGGDRALFYSDSEALARSHKGNQLLAFRSGLAHGEMVLHFQPIVELASDRTVAVEALLRWRHPTRGLLTPEEFRRVLDLPYNSLKADHWIIAEAAGVLGRWQAEGRLVRLHVNLSSASLESPEFCDGLLATLGNAPRPVDPRSLNLEWSEDGVSREVESARRLIAACHAHGIAATLDHFGTGPASLQHLSALSLDAIKIDQRLVAELPAHEDARRLVRGLIAAARAMGLTVMAEGITSIAQKTLLAELGCTYGQGPLFAEPCPETALWGPASAP